MGRLKLINERLGSTRAFWRPRVAWLGIAVATAFLFAACTSGGSPSETASTTGSISNSAPPASSAPSVSRSADAVPDFELSLFETPNYAAGEVIKLSQFQGQPVVLNFWFPSCPPCVAEMPDLEASFQEHRADGVQFIGVQLLGIDTAEDGQAFVDKLGVTYALGPDEDSDITFNQFKVPGFPTTFFLDGNQNIVKKWTGPLNRAKLEELVQELLNLQPARE